MGIATHTVLRTEQCNQIHVRRFGQNVYGRSQPIVHSSRIGNQPHPFSFEQFEVLLFQHLDSGLDGYRPGRNPECNHTRKSD